MTRLASLYRSVLQLFPFRRGHPLFLPIYITRYISNTPLNVELNHGLANRLITLTSCIIASRDLGKTFRFSWPLNSSCGCRFSDLFSSNISLIGPTRCIDFNDDTTFRPAFLTKRKSLFFSTYSYHKFEKGSLLSWDLHNTPFINGRIDNVALHFSRVLQSLSPTQDVIDLVPDLPPRTIGVHIRRADLPWQNYSPVSKFIQVMERYLELDDHLTFFLATDSEDVVIKMKGRFGQRIQCLLGPRSRTDLSGMQYALADLISLSMSSHILGTYNSSFSWLASTWGLVDLEIVTAS